MRLARSLLPLAAASLLAACTDSPTQPPNGPLAARCAQLLALFDKYGVQHSQGSGGPDIIFLGAGVDCSHGRYEQGIKAMEDLLQRNKIPYPPASDVQPSRTAVASISTRRPGTASALTATRVEVTAEPFNALPSALLTAPMSRISVT
jgi:hypothetical protein